MFNMNLYYYEYSIVMFLVYLCILYITPRSQGWQTRDYVSFKFPKSNRK